MSAEDLEGCAREGLVEHATVVPAAALAVDDDAHLLLTEGTPQVLENLKHEGHHREALVACLFEGAVELEGRRKSWRGPGGTSHRAAQDSGAPTADTSPPKTPTRRMKKRLEIKQIK